jgi:predicted RNase H-like nuclease (RuvC/YqgF family)
MMEYVKIDPDEQVSGKKNLLYCQMELLSITQRYQTYKKLRKEELNLKTLLKRKITELKKEVKELDAILPRVAREHASFGPKDKVSGKKKSELDMEIEEIKRKIAQLTGELA